MQNLFNIINKPLGWVLENISSIFGGNFAAAVFVFTLLINVLLIPLSIKSQKSMVQQTRIKPKLDDLKKRYGDDKKKYTEAMQKLYQDEGVSLAGGGCLPMILRLVLMLSIYWLIMSPLTYMAGVEKSHINSVNTVITQNMNELEKSNKEKYLEYAEKINWSKNSSRNELGIVNLVRGDSEVLKEILDEKEYAKIEKDLEEIKVKDRESNVNYTLFTEKLNLTQTPKFSFNIFKGMLYSLEGNPVHLRL